MGIYIILLGIAALGALVGNMTNGLMSEIMLSIAVVSMLLMTAVVID